MAFSASKGNGRERGSRRRAVSDINVTPMVDVMLVLLVIFMVTAPMLTTGIPLDLPRAQSKPMEGSDVALNVSVDADGMVYLGKDRVDYASLVSKLESIKGQNADIRIVVSGDRKADYGTVIEVMALLKNAGFAKVGLKTDASKAQHVRGKK